MADTVKMPVVGEVKKPLAIAMGALAAGIVGYAYWTRRRAATAPPTAQELEDTVPQDREPPPTIVGTQEFDDANVRAIISTNTEWFGAAVSYLTDNGYDFTFTTLTLGKFLARRELTDAEAQLVQAAKGAEGEPPQGGPWAIIRAGAPGPSTGSGTGKLPTPAVRVGAGNPRNTNWAILWTRVPGAQGYIVQRSSGPGAPKNYPTVSNSRRTPGLQPGKTYGYRVKALSYTPGIASSDWSPEVRFTVPAARAA